MSAIAGICHWDRRPVAPAVAAELGEHSRIYGPDASSSVTPHPWLLLQSHLTHFDRLSAIERQPVTFAGGSVLTWDGRLDNRDDLLPRLQREVGADHSDASLVAAAYARWGLDALPELIGDWSLAIWDSSEQRVVLARDYAGARPLFYLQQPGTFAWATSIDALIRAFRLTTPNDEFIAKTYASIGRADITPYVGLHMLRSAHVLISRADALTGPKRYWTFSAQPVVYSRPQDYIDHLRHLLIEAVRVRLRSTRPVWSHLSGGLDSSSIVCIAHRLISTGAVGAPGLRTLTWSTGGREVGEEDRVEAVERWCNLTTVSSPFVRYIPTATMLAEGERWRPMGWYINDHEPEAVEAGARVLMTGNHGDLVMMNGPQTKLEFLDLLFQGHPLRFMRTYADVAKRLKVPLWSIFRKVIRELYYDEKQMRTAGRRKPRRSGLLEGLTPDLKARIPAPLSNHSLVREFSRIRRPLALSMYGTLEGPSHVGPLLRTDPYSHRPLTQFMLAVPPMALVTHTTNRAGMKAALAEILPPEILSRTDKVIYLSASERLNAARVDDFLDYKHLLPPANQWELVRHGYIDAAFLSKVLESQVDYRGRSTHFIMTSIDLEMWLKHIARTSQYVRPPNVAHAGGTLRGRDDTTVAIATP